MNDNTSKHSNNDLLDDMYSNTAHYHTNQEQTTNHNLYTITDNKLRSSSDLEDLDWDITDNHKGELIIAYDNKIGNKILYPRTFYTLYVEPNQEGNGHIVYSLDEDQIVVTKNYRTTSVPEDLVRPSIKNNNEYTQESKEILQSSLIISLR